MIVVTGGKGFIGSNLIKKLEKLGGLGVVCLDIEDDTLENLEKWMVDNAKNIDFIFHLGANTNTLEFDVEVFNKYNLGSSKFIWNLCAENHIPLVYASSAATYGDGEDGFDDTTPIDKLKPLNPYGQSKQDFDIWVLKQEKKPPFWAGLKFFNVYGKGEEKKGKMASLIYQKYLELVRTSSIFNSFELSVKIFKSYKEGFADGEQRRDYIYVDDIVNVCIYLYNNPKSSGIYNLGTGKARTFNDIISVMSDYYGEPISIEYVEMPEEIRDKFQYNTEAKMRKLRNIGYLEPFTDLEHGIPSYLDKL